MKAYLSKAILATIRSKDLGAPGTASSGVIASVLSDGQITHSLFKILPIGPNTR
jgi:hypothetical protein